MATPQASEDADGDSAIPDTSSNQQRNRVFPFANLPAELANRIISLACRAPGPSIPAYENVSCRSPLALDVDTTLSLAQVSKAVNEVVVGILYYAIRITRPSALLELLRTVSLRPDLARLIKNLHIGAEETLADTGWPLEVETTEDGEELDYPTLRLKTSPSCLDCERRPKWCSGQQSWSLEPGRLDCRGAAVTKAINTAFDAIDVEPYRRKFARSGERIGLEKWSIRLFMVQACLDLYLFEVRRIEDLHGYLAGRPTEDPPEDPHICRLGKCGHYPRFVLTASNRGADDDSFSKQKTFTVTRAQIWSHLTRHNGALDQFDHPILFARSGLKAEHINDYGRSILRARLQGPDEEHFTTEEYDPHADEIDHSSDEDSESNSEEPVKVKLPKLARGFTIPGIVDATCEVLEVTTNVVNLSLGGYLYLSLSVANTVFKTLRSLSLGPLLPFWTAAIAWGEDEGANSTVLENLYLSGDILLDDEAEQIAGEDGRLPRLRRFVWELLADTEPFPELFIPASDLFDHICRLQGREGAAPGPPRQIEIRLDPQTRSSVLDLAAGELRAAWQTGKASSNKQDGPHRVHVVESSAANVQLTQPEETAKKLQQNVREWWEDCAALAKYPDCQRPKDWMPNASGRCGVEAKRVDDEEEEEQEEKEE